MQEPNDQEINHWDNLPAEIKTAIFFFLNTKDLGFFSICSKQSAADILFSLKERREELANEIAFAISNTTFFCYTTQALSSWGDNKYGQLGLGDNHYRITPNQVPFVIGKIKQVHAKNTYTLLLTEDGFYATGRNECDALSFGYRENHQRFTRVPFQSIGQIKQIAASPQGDYTLLLTEDDQGTYLFGCGFNAHGQLGPKSIITRATAFMPISVPKEMGEIQQIYAGDSSSYFVTDSGLFVCGRTSTSLFLQISEPVSEFAEVLLVEHVGHIKQVIVGMCHIFVLTDQGLYAKGENYYGELGLGTKNFFDDFTKIPLAENIGKIKQVIEGCNHTILLTDKGLYISGTIYYGQLGFENSSLEPVRFNTFTKVLVDKAVGRIHQVYGCDDKTFLLTDNGLFFCGAPFEDPLIRSHDKIRTINKFVKIEEIPEPMKTYHKFISCINYLENFLKKQNELEDTTEIFKNSK
jgi:alpha-tubulin suppressor-like RCC1 family protein